MTDQEKVRTILNYLTHLPPGEAVLALGDAGSVILGDAVADLAADLGIQKSQLEGQIAAIDNRITEIREAIDQSAAQQPA